MSPFSPTRYRVLFNPIAGRRKQSRIHDIVGRLRSNGADVDITPTSGPGHAVELARDAALASDVDVIIAAGGDGTISECATGLLEAGRRGVSYDALVPLGILPMGTANVLAMDLGLVTVAGIARRRIARTLLCGNVRPLQVGLVSNALEERAFVMMVGAGFDGAAVGAVDPITKKRFGKVAYVKAGIEAIIAGPGEGAVLEQEGKPLSKSAWVIVTNGQHYAGGYRLTKRTSLNRRGLAALSINGISRLSIVRSNAALGLRLFDSPQNSKAHMGDTFRIDGPGRDCLVEVDGDYFGLAPVE
ncbi:MAG: diacylglycerol kinase family protein, partial [Pseudomonadota bacterium]